MKIYNGTPSAFTSDLASKLSEANISWTSDSNEKPNCDFLLYIITSDLDGIRHIIEAVNDSNHWKQKTIFCTLSDQLEDGFTEHQKKSLVATGKMVRVNGGNWFESESDLLNHLEIHNK